MTRSVNLCFKIYLFVRFLVFIFKFLLYFIYYSLTFYKHLRLIQSLLWESNQPVIFNTTETPLSKAPRVIYLYICGNPGWVAALAFTIATSVTLPSPGRLFFRLALGFDIEMFFFLCGGQRVCVFRFTLLMWGWERPVFLLWSVRQVYHVTILYHFSWPVKSLK